MIIAITDASSIVDMTSSQKAIASSGWFDSSAVIPRNVPIPESPSSVVPWLDGASPTSACTLLARDRSSRCASR